MKVLFDYQAFVIQKYGGISRYYAEMIQLLTLKRNLTIKLSLLTSDNLNLKIVDKFQIPNILGETKFPGKRTVIVQLNKVNSLIAIISGKYDVFHPTYYDSYFLNYLNKKPFVLTVHDTIHERFRYQFPILEEEKPYVLDKRKLINAAAKIIAVSHCTKTDLIKFYGTDPDKIEVVHLSYTQTVNNNNIQSKFYFDSSLAYLLFVGHRSVYKNFEFTIVTIASYIKKHGYLFVCAGGPPFTVAEKSLISSLNIDHLVIYQPINDVSLNQLYSKARVFIFPSLFEGFGLPVLEAMSNYCPCLLSNGGSLPEVGGEAAIYFNPEDGQSLIQALELIMENSRLRKSLVELGAKRVRDFSWQKTSDRTYEIYKSLV